MIPDIVHFEASAILEWAARGLLERVDDLFPVDWVRRNYFPSEAAEVIWQNRVWGIPGYANVRGLFWHVDILDEIGMDSARGPQTLAELEELARKALKRGPDGRSSGRLAEKSTTLRPTCRPWSTKRMCGPGTGFSSGPACIPPVN